MTAPATWPPRARAAPAQFTEPPIVIGGCARSGTTLLLSILSCHPRIYAIPEETQLLCYGTFEKTPTCHAPLVGELYFLLTQRRPQATARRWCEKTPRNALCFTNIQAALPHAKLVHLVRDGRDVCTSRHPGNPADYWVPASRWMRETSAALACPSVYHVRYEDLALSYEQTIRDLLDWIGEDWDDHLDDYPAHAMIGTSRAWAHDAIPLHAEQIGRWQRQEHQQAVRDFFTEPGTHTRLAQFGYAA